MYEHSESKVGLSLPVQKAEFNKVMIIFCAKATDAMLSLYLVLLSIYTWLINTPPSYTGPWLIIGL